MSVVTDDVRFREVAEEIMKGDEPKNMCTVLDKVQSKGRQEGQNEMKKDMAGLMSFLASNGRSDDIVKAGQDESFLNKLLADFRNGLMVAK